MRNAPDISAPILPGVGLGGLRLGQSYSTWKKLFEETWSDSDQVEHALLCQGRIEVVADRNRDLIIGLLALPGYEGKMLEKIAPGTTFAQALEHLPCLLYNDFEASLYEPQELSFILKHESFDAAYLEMLDDPIYSVDIRDWEHEYWWHFRPLISDHGD